MKLTLTRDYLGQDCTQGKIAVAELLLDTMERPWIPIPDAPCGRKGNSCVGPGIYKLVRHNSEAHPRSFALVNPDLWVYHWDEDVPPPQKGIARTLILIHPANIAIELAGCIAPGQGHAVDSMGRRMVTHSRLAMDQINQSVPWDDGHELEIA